MMFASFKWNPPWMSRLSDDAIRLALSDEEDDYVRENVLWHIVYTRRAALYPDLLAQSGVVRFRLLGGSVHPVISRIDQRLAKALARQAFERVRAGEKEELEFLLYKYTAKPIEPFEDFNMHPDAPHGNLPFKFLEREEQRWVAKHYPAEVARVIGYHGGMRVCYNPQEALDILRRAGFDEVKYEIRGEAAAEQVLAFNRRVCEAEDKVPADALLIKEGFDWEVEAGQIWPNYTTGGFVYLGAGESCPEYDVTVAVEPRKWLYRSRSGRSAIAFKRKEDGTWQFEGRVSLNCLHELKVGIEPTIRFGLAEISLSSLLEVAEATA